MFIKQVTKDTYEDQAHVISECMLGITALAKAQIGLLRTISNTELRKQLVDNGKEMYRAMRDLGGAVVKHSRSAVKRDTSPNMKSGFAKPLPISSALAEFTGWSTDEPRSRNEATRAICDYIKAEGLSVASDRRQIVPDAKLGALLGTRDTVTYNHIQSVLKDRCFAC